MDCLNVETTIINSIQVIDDTEDNIDDPADENNIVTSDNAVSYTHLDVYKRQIFIAL